MGSAALAAAVTNPGKATKFPQGTMKYLQKNTKTKKDDDYNSKQTPF